MYPIKLGFGSARDRVDALLANGHSAEALVTSVFTLEKFMRRSLRMAIIARGFSSDQATRLIGRKGFREIREIWDVFDHEHRKLPEIIGQKLWQHVPEAVEMRNKLVHGERVYALDACRVHAEHVLKALTALRDAILESYGADPWSRMSSRKHPRLEWLAPVRRSATALKA